jgi:hypothetical protein
MAGGNRFLLDLHGHCSYPLHIEIDETPADLARIAINKDGAGDGTRIRLYLYGAMHSHRNLLILNGSL